MSNGKKLTTETLAHKLTSYLCGNIAQEIADRSITKYSQQEIAQQSPAAIVGAFTKETGGLLVLLQNSTFRLFHYLGLVSKYFAGEFIPRTDDKDFLGELGAIWHVLIDKGYFGDVYVAYSEELRELEKAALASAKPKIDGYDPNHFPSCNLRIYIKEKKGKYRSCLTNVGNLNLDPEKLVHFSASGFHNFMGGVLIITDYLAGLSAFTTSFGASLKTNICYINDQKEFEAEQQQIMTNYNNVFGILDAGTGNDNHYKPYVMFEIEKLISVLKNNKAFFDERASFYGMYGRNLGEKKERVTVGENELDFKSVDNMQMQMLINLRSSFQRLKKIYPEIPEDFTIANNRMEMLAARRGVSIDNPQGIPEATPVTNESHLKKTHTY